RMKEKLFPKEIIEHTQEKNFSTHSVSSKVIYITILTFLIGALLLIPFIYVDVGIRSQGLVRPVTEVVPLASPVSGHIQLLMGSENSAISRGELFALIEAPEINERLRFNKRRKEQLSDFISDIQTLQQFDSLSVTLSTPLQSPRYQRNWLEFRQHLINQQETIRQLKRTHDRKKHLFEKKALSQAAFDEAAYSWKHAVNQKVLQAEQQLNQWSIQEITYLEEMERITSESTQLQQELIRHEIRSPVAGTIQNASGIFQNSFIHANQILAEVSPDTNLIAEIYVSPNDIGLLYEGMPVRFQVDAYNFHSWGILNGQIHSIPGDVIVQDNSPFFRVRCVFDQTFLELENGFRGDLKKGMTVQARFIVNRRSLFQLLFDKIDDWLNPVWGN
ncbi:HlyD family efflux transporter periplasmic adaptor subunit, partial [Balneolaceae bacterium ANBcel3]|nr:HlyD family efflux transporter periplasmic adaptor subunit [Balneolaceae bacterium ANBcel3]